MHHHNNRFYLPIPEIVTISLGANMGNPTRKLREAINDLNRLNATLVFGTSGLYHSAPVGPVAQPPFINVAVLLETRLPPSSLLAELKAIEHTNGRKRRGQSWGPRILDLDIITYGNQVIAGDRLNIPHPEAHKRCFVLQPLQEIAPDLHIPNRGKIRELASHCKKHDVYRIGTLKPLAVRTKSSAPPRAIKQRKATASRIRFLFSQG